MRVLEALPGPAGVEAGGADKSATGYNEGPRTAVHAVESLRGTIAANLHVT